jgi:hypothetical protein
LHQFKEVEVFDAATLGGRKVDEAPECARIASVICPVTGVEGGDLVHYVEGAGGADLEGVSLGNLRARMALENDIIGVHFQNSSGLVEVGAAATSS